MSHGCGRQVRVSHWSVDTEAATKLTTATFDIVTSDRKLGRAEALRRAMLDDMSDASDPLNAAPRATDLVAINAPMNVVDAIIADEALRQTVRVPYVRWR
jgi:hypothetical protein